MKCINCGKDNPPDNKFCDNCGNVLSPDQPATPPAPSVPASGAPGTECPACKHVNPPGSAFCDNCGAALQSAPAPAPVAPPVQFPTTPAPPAPPVIPKIQKVLVLPDGAELALDAKKTFGRVDFARQASDPMWVSRAHFTIFEENGENFIQDDGSSNGTKLNGKEIKQTGKQQLKSGDEIIVGDALKVIFKTK